MQFECLSYSITALRLVLVLCSIIPPRSRDGIRKAQKKHLVLREYRQGAFEIRVAPFSPSVLILIILLSLRISFPFDQSIDDDPYSSAYGALHDRPTPHYQHQHQYVACSMGGWMLCRHNTYPRRRALCILLVLFGNKANEHMKQLSTTPSIARRTEPWFSMQQGYCQPR